jgi:hypothetical protein
MHFHEAAFARNPIVGPANLRSGVLAGEPPNKVCVWKCIAKRRNPPPPPKKKKKKRRRRKKEEERTSVQTANMNCIGQHVS